MSEINSVLSKYKIEDNDVRFEILKRTELFSEHIIKKFLEEKQKKELDKIKHPLPKISPKMKKKNKEREKRLKKLSSKK